jgi:hypothetical protein
MGGEAVHRWHVPFSKVLKETGQTDRAAEPVQEVEAREVNLLANGDLLVVYERPHHTPYGRGLARFDSDGRVIWGLVEHLHHDVAVAPSGRLYALAHEIFAEPRERLAAVEAPFFDEFLVVISPDDTILDRISIYEAFDRSPFRDHAAGGSRQPVWRLPAPECGRNRDAGGRGACGRVEGRPGSCLAARNGCTCANRRRPPRGGLAPAGQGHRQHDPDLLPNGRIVVFDNQGVFASDGLSRVVEVDPQSGALVWQFSSTRRRR